jgi:hypothetical protein
MNNEGSADRPRAKIDDSVLDRYLEALPRFDPMPGFEDRVMARVFVPPPLWVQSLRQYAVSLVETRRIWWLAAGTAIASVMSWIVVVILVLRDIEGATAAVEWASAHVAAPARRAVLMLASDGIQRVFALLPLQASKTATCIVGAAVVALEVFCAVMLLRLLRPLRQGGVE